MENLTKQKVMVMLLDARLSNEAKVVNAADLRKNPENGYSLFGLLTALKEQGKNGDTAIRNCSDKIWADSTHKLKSSRF